MGNYTCHADGYEKLFQTHVLQVNGEFNCITVKADFPLKQYRSSQYGPLLGVLNKYTFSYTFGKLYSY